MRRRKRRTGILKVVGILIVLVVLAVAGGMMFLTRGLSDVQHLVIGDVDLSNVADGVYTGRFQGYRWSNTVEVTLEDHQIIGIEQTQTQRFHVEEPMRAVIARILAHQTLDVDIPSGATVSSKALLKAVEDALSP